METMANHIARSYNEVRSMLADPVNNIAAKADFPQVGRPGRCKRCNFQQLCNSGAED